MLNGGLYRIMKVPAFIPGPTFEYGELIKEYSNIPDSKRTEIVTGVALSDEMDTDSLIKKIDDILSR